MNSAEVLMDHGSRGSLDKKCPGGTLLHYFQKKSDAGKPTITNGKCDNVTECHGDVSRGTGDQTNGTSFLEESEDVQPFSCAPSHHGTAEGEDVPQRENYMHSSSSKEQRSSPTDTPHNDCLESKEACQGSSDMKKKGSHETNSGLSDSSRKQTQNPFQILMESRKKKGVWDKPTAKAKESESRFSDDECIEAESEATVRSTVESGSAKFFSIFSKKSNKNSSDPNMCNGVKADGSTKDTQLKNPFKKSESPNSDAGRGKSPRGVPRSSLDSKKSSTGEKLSDEGNAKRAKLEKTSDRKSFDRKRRKCSSDAKQMKRDKSDCKDKEEPDTPATPKKSRFKVVSDSDFEPDNLQSRKRKDRAPSKSHGSSSKRPRTESVSCGDADSSSKPATLSAAKKLVKKSREHKRRSGDGSRRDSTPSDKPRPKQTLLTAGQDSTQPPASDVKPDTGTPQRRSGRPRAERRQQPSDSEVEFTPGRRAKSRRKVTNEAEESTPGRNSDRKRSSVKQVVELSDNDSKDTPARKSAKRTSGSAQQRRHSSGTDIEVLSTKKKSRHPSADVVEIAAENRPAERRSSRPRRPVILSESETEPSPVKKPSRRSRDARPVTPIDSETETTPVKKLPRRSSRPSRPVRRLSDSEIELSPVKKPARGGGKRSAAADEPEVVLVRSRSTGAAGAKSGRNGVDAFQMMKRGGRPPKQTAAEKAAIEARRAFLASGVPESLQVQAEVARRLEESLTPLFPEVSHIHQRSGQDPAPPVESGPLPAGLRWRAELPPSTVSRPAFISGLVPGLAGRLEKAAGSGGSSGGQAGDMGAGGDSGSVASSSGGDGADSLRPAATSEAGDTDEPASSVTASASSLTPSPPRLPYLSATNCTDALHDLLSTDRENTSSSSSTPDSTLSTPGPTVPALWTERFRPRRHGSFLGGSAAAEELREWLAEWSPPSVWEDDGSEEPAGDGTVLLLGPTGCGKTSAVYAAAAQLGFQVLEVSASNRRSGRHLSSQLSEATQSQRVSLPGGGTSAAEPPSRSLILLEDVQLVSEELDDGFLAAAASLAAAAKRPVVLTSGDSAVTRTRLLRSLPHRLLTVTAPPAGDLRTRLALVALTQGWLLPEKAATRLAEGRDVRRAILQLQWLCEGQGDGEDAERADTGHALKEAGLEEVEGLTDKLPAALKVVKMPPVMTEDLGTVGEVPELPTEAVGRRESGWQPPARETAAGYDGQTRRRWRCVDPDLFSDEDDTRRAPSPTPAPPAPDGAPPEPEPERDPPEERALLSASVAAIASLCELRSACDALVTPAERCVMDGWWRRRPGADMSELEHPRCVTEERCDHLGRQIAKEALLAASRRCSEQLRTARVQFSSTGRSEPPGLCLPLYDDHGVRDTAWEEGSRITPAVPSLLLSRRAGTADLLPSIRRVCRLECGRRATDGGRTRRFLHYFDQMGLHAVPTDLRTNVCKSLM